MSLQIKRILIARDLTEESSNVIRYGLELGSKFDARIHLLHVMPTVDTSVLNMVALVMGPDKLAQLNAANEQSIADQTREQLDVILREETERSDVRLKHSPEI